MSILLEALRTHQPLPAGWPHELHTWPQVMPMTAAPRPRWPAGLPGAGDEATWGPCDGHPNDPRTPEREHAGTAAALDDVIDSLRAARDEIEREDLWTPRVATLVREAIETLLQMEVEP